MRVYKLINLILAFVFAASLLAMPAGAAAQGLEPVIGAGPNQGYVYGFGWPNGDVIHMTVQRGIATIYQADATVGPCGAGNPGLGPCGPNDVYFDLGGFPAGLQGGDGITLEGGGLTRSMTVSHVQATGIDINTGTLSGIAEPGQPVYMVVGSPQNIPAYPDQNGNWTVVLGTQYTQWGMGGGVKQCDGDGNCTVQAWSVPVPYIAADANSLSIQARERDWLPLALWSAGTQVTLTIDDPTTSETPDYSATAYMQPNYNTQGEEYATFADFGWPAIGLKPGYIVSISGPQVTKTLTISLDVSDINLQADTVAGVAEPGAQIHLCANVGDNCISRYVTSGATGTWLVDYANPGSRPDEQQTVDIVPGMNFSASETDANFDEYWTHWRVLNPYVQAGPNQGFVYARDWPSGVQVHLTVARSGTTIYTADATVGPCGAGNPGSGPCGPNDAYFDLGYFDTGVPRLDLLAGDVIAVTGGGITSGMVVSALAITSLYASTDRLEGIADVGREVNVGTCDGHSVTIMPDSGGHWVADFAPFDLLPGMCGGATQFDENGNYTQQGWVVPKPFIQANPVHQWILVHETEPLGIHSDWTLGTKLTLAIDDPSNGPSIDYTGFATLGNDPNRDDPNDLLANFEWPAMGLQTGFVLTVQANGLSKTLVISPLQVQAIDAQADTISGIATPGAIVQMCANLPNTCISRFVTADGSGNWLANYHVPGDKPDELIVDLKPGEDGWAAEWDIDDDQTWADWRVPSPFIVASPAERYIEAREQDEPPLIAWPVGTLLTLKIDNPANGVGVDYTGTAIMGQDPRDPGNPNDLWADFAWPAMGLRTGFIVTVSGNGASKTLVISPIQVNKIDVLADTVAGFSAPGAYIQVCVYSTDGCIDRFVTANAAGLWSANFHQTLDILPGMSGWAAVTDQDGDQVGVHWQVPVTGWKPANASGFGDSRNSAITALEVFQGQLYAGTFNQNSGGQIWRLGTKGQWSRVMDAGFGAGPGNPAVIDLAFFGGQLYAGTGWNGIPGQVWRSADGRNWQAVTTDGFGQAGNTAVTNFVLFNNMLYAGTGHASGGSVQIWRSSSGRSGTWQQVAPDGPGSSGGNVTSFAVYKNVLYAAVESAIMATPEGYVGPPAQVWRSINGSDWMTVTAPGFGDQNNISPGGFAQLNGYLYLGTLNQATGAQIWRTNDGLHWTKVMGNGFGDLNNIKVEALFVYNNQLYAVTNNSSRGLQVWRSSDGSHWLAVLVNGFGDSANLSTVWSSATVLFQGQAYIGTWNNNEGGQLWMSTP